MITARTAEFREALPGAGRLLGLDVGTKTIGVAVCDAGWTIATPAELIARAKFSADLARLKALATAQRVTGIVIGLPLNLDGSESPRTQSVRAFAHNVEPLGLPILLWDERWSTQAVTRIRVRDVVGSRLDADASRARRAELVDKMAAAYILQGAIDALAGGQIGV